MHGLSETYRKQRRVGVSSFIHLFCLPGESVDISDGDMDNVALTDSGQTLREKMVYMSVGDSHHQENHGE